MLQSAIGCESGPIPKRRACAMWARWIELAGGSVRGAPALARAPAPPVAPAAPKAAGPDAEPMDELWPLEVLDAGDAEQMDVVYPLLRASPHAIVFYLHEHVFPHTLKYAPFQLSASGQELGGDVLFPVRIGFSGTPSDLLPREFGQCQYQKVRGAGGAMGAPALCSAAHHVAAHHITSHHITSHHITSHHITSHRIASHHITSHHITSHHITSHHITSHHITSHHITSHHITSHHIISQPPPLDPPDQSDHRGKKRNLPSGNLIGPFLVHKFLGPRFPTPF